MKQVTALAFFLLAFLAGISFLSAKQEGYAFRPLPHGTKRLELEKFDPLLAPPLRAFLQAQDPMVTKSDGKEVWTLEGSKLLKNAQGNTYIAAIWHSGSDWLKVFEVQDAKDGAPVFTPVLQMSAMKIALFEPVGFSKSGGVDSSLIIEKDDGGSDASGHEIDMRLLKDGLSPVVTRPRAHIVAIENLSGNSVPELIVRLDDWRGFDTRGMSGPFAYAVLKNTNSTWVPACKDYAQIYEHAIQADTKRLEERGVKDFPAETIGNSVLAHLQIGEFEEAKYGIARLKRDFPQSAKPAQKLQKAYQRAFAAKGTACLLY